MKAMLATNRRNFFPRSNDVERRERERERAKKDTGRQRRRPCTNFYVFRTKSVIMVHDDRISRRLRKEENLEEDMSAHISRHARPKIHGLARR